MPTEKKVTTKVVNSHGKKDLDLHSSQIPSRTDWSALNLARNALKKKGKRPGSWTSELQLKVDCRPKVNCKIEFGLDPQPTVGRPAQILSYNSILV